MATCNAKLSLVRMSKTKDGIRRNNLRSVINNLRVRRLKIDYDTREGMGVEQSVNTARTYVSTYAAETVLWDVLSRVVMNRHSRRYTVHSNTVEAAMLLLLLKSGAFDKGTSRPQSHPLTTTRRAKQREDKARKIIKARHADQLDDMLGLFHNPSGFKDVLRGESFYFDKMFFIGLRSLEDRGAVEGALKPSEMWKHEIGIHPVAAYNSVAFYLQALIYYGVRDAMLKDAERCAGNSNVAEFYNKVAGTVNTVAWILISKVKHMADTGEDAFESALIDANKRLADILPTSKEFEGCEERRIRCYRSLLVVVMRPITTGKICQHLFHIMDSPVYDSVFTYQPVDVMSPSFAKENVLINEANKYISDAIEHVLDTIINVTSPFYRFSPMFDLNAVINDDTLVNTLINARMLYTEGDTLVYTAPTLRSVIKTWTSPANKRNKANS